MRILRWGKYPYCMCTRNVCMYTYYRWGYSVHIIRPNCFIYVLPVNRWTSTGKVIARTHETDHLRSVDFIRAGSIFCLYTYWENYIARLLIPGVLNAFTNDGLFDVMHFTWGCVLYVMYLSWCTLTSYTYKDTKTNNAYMHYPILTERSYGTL